MQTGDHEPARYTQPVFKPLGKDDSANSKPASPGESGLSIASNSPATVKTGGSSRQADNARYYAKHREAISEQRRMRRREHPDEVRGIEHTYYVNNRERLIPYKVNWQRNKRERSREQRQ